MRPLWILGALAVLDVLFFVGWIAREEHVRRTGAEVKLPIEGYDPRDLLRGHYVQFRLVAEREAEGERARQGATRFCLEERQGRWHVKPEAEPSSCRYSIEGSNRSGKVRFGIERFYVDERRAREVLQLPADRDTYLIAHLDRGGGIHPRELVVGGKPFSAPREP